MFIVSINSKCVCVKLRHVLLGLILCRPCSLFMTLIFRIEEIMSNKVVNRQQERFGYFVILYHKLSIVCRLRLILLGSIVTAGKQISLS